VTMRDRILAGVAATVAVVGAFWFLALHPRLDHASKLSDQVSQATVRRDQAEADAAQAQAAKAAYSANYATVARLGKSVPVDDEVPSLVYQLDTAAKATGIDFRAVKLAGGAVGSPAAATQPSASASSSSTSGSTPASASATQTAVATLPPGASIGPAGFPSMPFSFTFRGNFFTLEHFLRKVGGFTGISGKQIRVGGRLLTLDGISLSAAPEGFPHITASISATAFLVPADQGATGGATPTGPATTTTAAEVTP
jgi:hypothetical protein